MVTRRRRSPPLTSDELRRYLSYIVRSLDDIRAALHAFLSDDETAIKDMITTLKRSNDLLDAAQRDATKKK